MTRPGAAGPAGSRALARALGPGTADRLWGRSRLTVLAYHRIVEPRELTDGHPGVVSASPAAFERQMDWVAREFSVISLDDLCAHVASGAPLPERPLLITFDDGYRDNHDAALPILRARGLPAVVFLITGAIGTNRSMWWDEVAGLVNRAGPGWADLPLLGPRRIGEGGGDGLAEELLARLKGLPDAALRDAVLRLRAMFGPGSRDAGGEDARTFMDWEEVGRMAAGGVACEPHTHEHPLLTRVPAARAREEIRRSARVVARRTGRRARAFAYPNGSYDTSTVGMLRDEGIPLAFTTRPGPVRIADARRRPREIPRISVGAGDDLARFRLKVAGAAAVAARAREVLPVPSAA